MTSPPPPADSLYRRATTVDMAVAEMMEEMEKREMWNEEMTEEDFPVSQRGSTPDRSLSSVLPSQLTPVFTRNTKANGNFSILLF